MADIHDRTVTRAKKAASIGGAAGLLSADWNQPVTSGSGRPPPPRNVGPAPNTRDRRSPTRWRSSARTSISARSSSQRVERDYFKLHPATKLTRVHPCDETRKLGTGCMDR